MDGRNDELMKSDPLSCSRDEVTKTIRRYIGVGGGVEVVVVAVAVSLTGTGTWRRMMKIGELMQQAIVASLDEAIFQYRTVQLTKSLLLIHVKLQ